MIKSIDSLKKNYQAFIKLIENDCPYPLEGLLEGNEFKDAFEEVHCAVEKQHSKIKNSYYSKKGQGIIDFMYLDHYLILCFRLANLFHNKGKNFLADAIYYSCRIRTTTDLYYRCDVGDYFIPVHPIGSIMDSHSTYGKGFRLYDGVHTGPFNITGKEAKEWIHPKFGDGVIIYNKASVFGKCNIGNNVIITPGTVIINQDVPDNCIAFGNSPNIKVMPNRENNLSIIDL